MRTYDTAVEWRRVTWKTRATRAHAFTEKDVAICGRKGELKHPAEAQDLKCQKCARMLSQRIAWNAHVRKTQEQA